MIHNVKKYSETLSSYVFEVVAKSNQRVKAGRGYILLLDQTTKDTSEVQRVRKVPLGRGLVRTLTHTTSRQHQEIYWLISNHYDPT